jgi:hypothetical protein
MRSVPAKTWTSAQELGIRLGDGLFWGVIDANEVSDLRNQMTEKGNKPGSVLWLRTYITDHSLYS